MTFFCVVGFFLMYPLLQVSGILLFVFFNLLSISEVFEGMGCALFLLCEGWEVAMSI